MGAKVRYILGAGASYGSVALVKDMPQVVWEYGQALNLLVKGLSPISSTSKDFQVNKKLQAFSDRLLEEYQTLSAAFSFDTYAKFLWAKPNEVNYYQLKFIIETVILLEELTNPRNPRYDAFIAALAIQNKELVMPENIQVLNWNYDNQFLGSLNGIDSTIRRPDQIKEYLNHHYINGVAKYYVKRDSWHGEKFEKDFYNSINPSLTNISEKYRDRVKEKTLSCLAYREHIARFAGLNFVQDFNEGIKYSWELSLEDLEEAMVFQPDYTVIIGYSLPTFNRSIDRKLLEPVLKGGTVYIQCGEGNDSVESKLLGMGINRERINRVDDVSEFFIPPEYDVI